MNFLIFNSDIIRKEEANFTPLFWDEPVVLTQKIWFGFGGIPLFNENIEDLIQQLNTFQIEIPKFLMDKRELFRICKRMLNKNRYYRSGILSLSLFLSKKKIQYIITSIPSPEFDFLISENGLLVSFSNIPVHSTNPLSRHSFIHSLHNNIEKSNLNLSEFHNSIVLNENGVICQGIDSNIFMIKDNVLITPAMEVGCYEDTIRSSILLVAGKLNIKTVELSNLKPEHIIEMDEIFLASEEHGIQWILGVQNKRFVHSLSDKICLKLNEYLKEKIS